MRPAIRHAFAGLLLSVVTLATPVRVRAANTPASAPAIDPETWVDHDRAPIRKPRDGEPGYWGRRLHEVLFEPIAHAIDVPGHGMWLARHLGAHPQREATDVNAFDETPDNSWFTNRNAMRAVPLAELRQGPDAVFLPRMPWTITHAKPGGHTIGFQIRDADGRKWLVKLDNAGYPQLSSGADVVARTLLHAAGYEVPHNEPVRFRRGDLNLDPKLLDPAAKVHLTAAELDTLLAKGAIGADGRYYGSASLFVTGHVLGGTDMLRARRGDTNDRFRPGNRRELRGLFTVVSWIGDWDLEDHQFLDAFVATHDTLGHVEHYVLDAGSSLGASAMGPKLLWEGYEHVVDYPWIATRFATLGFVDEPWRRARQETGIPSAGNFEADVFAPGDYRAMIQQPAFYGITDRDGYWGAKLVASFSDAQVAAAVDAARYEDPRARDYLVRALIARRDKIARYWFARVAPLDFFAIDGDTLRFHDLAVDRGLAAPRAYDVAIVRASAGGAARGRRRSAHAAFPLDPAAGAGARQSLSISVAGSHATPARVELTRGARGWVVSAVRHG